MMLKGERLATLLDSSQPGDDPLMIIPKPDIRELRKTGSASIDLRLGTWFAVLRQSRVSMLDISKTNDTGPSEHMLMKMHYVAFGDMFVLHPRSFVLGVSLEWLRLPANLAGYVTARSSWGRRGLIIATAVGIHPGFTGCLTLELSNVGETPVALYPGMAICQFFIHQVETTSEKLHKSRYDGLRRPSLGSIELDEVAKKILRK